METKLRRAFSSTCPLRTDFDTMEQLLAIALVVGVVVAAALFFMGGGKKKFLDKSRQKLKLGKITKVRASAAPLPRRARRARRAPQPPAPHPRPRAPQITHDTTKFTFDLPSPSMSLGLPLGKHVKIFAPNMTGVEAGKWSARPRPDASCDRGDPSAL